MQDAPAATGFAEARFVEVGSARVCYRVAGSGPAIVFLHGFPLSGMTWRNVVSRLADDHTCVAFDLIGLGGSRSNVDSDYASPGQAQAISRAITQLGIDSYTLAGNDTGGWVARELALLDGERVRHLALTNTEIPQHRPPWIPLYQIGVRLPGSTITMRQMLSSRTLRRSALGFGGCFQDIDFIDGEFGDLFVRPLLASNSRLLQMFRFLKEMRFSRIDEFKYLHGKLEMPVALLWGAADPTFGVERAAEMATQFPNLRDFSEVPGAKLFFYEEQPELVADWIREFAG